MQILQIYRQKTYNFSLVLENCTHKKTPVKRKKNYAKQKIYCTQLGNGRCFEGTNKNNTET